MSSSSSSSSPDVSHCKPCATSSCNGSRTSCSSSSSSSSSRNSKMVQQVLSVLYVLLLSDWLHQHTAQARSVKRLCKNEIDLLGDEGVYVEKYERSHVEIPLSDQSRGKSRNAIKFEFRTQEQNGLLFYGRREDEGKELIALRLIAGNLYYKIHCSTVAADVMIPHQHRLNDNTWHSVVVRFRRGGHKIRTQIEVDGIRDSKTYEVSCGQMTSLVFGGVRTQDVQIIDRIMGGYDHYEGCLRRANMPYGMSSPPKYYAISVCEGVEEDKQQHHRKRVDEDEDYDFQR